MPYDYSAMQEAMEDRQREFFVGRPCLQCHFKNWYGIGNVCDSCVHGPLAGANDNFEPLCTEDRGHAVYIYGTMKLEGSSDGPVVNKASTDAGLALTDKSCNCIRSMDMAKPSPPPVSSAVAQRQSTGDAERTTVDGGSTPPRADNQNAGASRGEVIGNADTAVTTYLAPVTAATWTPAPVSDVRDSRIENDA